MNSLQEVVRFSKEPSIEELLQFRSLIKAEDYLASHVMAEYQKTKNQKEFHEGIINIVRSGKRTTPSSGQVQQEDIPASLDSINSSKNSTLCFAFRETGVCKNDNCRFSHDPPNTTLSTTTSSITAPPPKENSLGKEKKCLKSILTNNLLRLCHF